MSRLNLQTTASIASKSWMGSTASQPLLCHYDRLVIKLCSSKDNWLCNAVTNCFVGKFNFENMHLFMNNWLQIKGQFDLDLCSCEVAKLTLQHLTDWTFQASGESLAWNSPGVCGGESDRSPQMARPALHLAIKSHCSSSKYNGSAITKLENNIFVFCWDHGHSAHRVGELYML